MAVIALSGQRWQGSSAGTGSFTPSGSFNVRYLVCAGGGGATTNNGGGSGAGGFRTDSSYGVTAQTYSIIVGEKGVGQTDTSGVAQNGGDSTFGSITSNGGGFGGGSDSSGNIIGNDGGSGGAGGDRGTKAGGSGNTPSTTPAQGYDGGNGGSYGSAGGGGGGAYEAGNDADGSGAGDGGAGIDSDITGSTINYCAGGGGATQAGSVGQGGNTSAGDGYGTGDGVGQNATTTAVGTSAGNGGGGGRGGAYKGGDGSDGIIILRFTTSGNSYSVVGGDVDTDGSDTVITFTVGNASGIDEKTTLLDSSTYGTAEFDGSGDYARVNNSVFNNVTDDWTVAMWYNTDDLATGDALIGCYSTGGSAGWQIYQKEGNLIISNGAIHARNNLTFSTGTWYHIAWVCTSGTLQMFVDGVVSNIALATGGGSYGSYTASQSYEHELDSPDDTLNFGQRGDTDKYLDGRLQDAGFWTRGLVEGDIVKLSAGVPIDKADLATVYTDALQGYFKFDGNFDSSVNGYTGTAYGNATTSTSGGKFNTYATSNLPNGTQFEETDVYKSYQLNVPDGWVERGTAI